MHKCQIVYDEKKTVHVLSSFESYCVRVEREKDIQMLNCLLSGRDTPPIDSGFNPKNGSTNDDGRNNLNKLFSARHYEVK
jgi:hypothetical protein